MNGITYFMVFCNWLLSLSIIFSRFILAFINTSFLSIAECYSIAWIYICPLFKNHLDTGAIIECFTYQHTHVRPHPQPGLGDSHSGKTLRCWCNAHSCRFLGSDTHQHLSRGEHKPGPKWVNLTLFLPIATTLDFHPSVFNFIIYGRYIDVKTNLISKCSS